MNVNRTEFKDEVSGDDPSMHTTKGKESLLGIHEYVFLFISVHGWEGHFHHLWQTSHSPLLLSSILMPFSLHVLFFYVLYRVLFLMPFTRNQQQSQVFALTALKA